MTERKLEQISRPEAEVPLAVLSQVSYHETSIRNPRTRRWRKGPIIKRTVIYVVVDGEPINLATVDKDLVLEPGAYISRDLPEKETRAQMVERLYNEEPK